MFISYSVCSQSYEDIKKMDTIYIPFRQGKYNIKIDFPEEKDGFRNREYIFNYKKKNTRGFYFEFKKTPNKIVETKVITKKILKENKLKIVEIDSLKKFEDQVIQCELFTRSKIFYLIDFSEKKGKKIKMYRVIFFSHCIVKE